MVKSLWGVSFLACRWPPSCCILTWGEWDFWSPPFLGRALIQVLEAHPPSWSYPTLIISPPITITLETRASTYEFWEDFTKDQSIEILNCIIDWSSNVDTVNFKFYISILHYFLLIFLNSFERRQLRLEKIELLIWNTRGKMTSKVSDEKNNKTYNFT